MKSYISICVIFFPSFSRTFSIPPFSHHSFPTRRKEGRKWKEVWGKSISTIIRRSERTALYWVHTPMDRSDVVDPKIKSRGATPSSSDICDRRARGDGQALSAWAERKDLVDGVTSFIYALKEIRACLEAELLTDVQQRLALLSRDMDNHNGHRVLHHRLSPQLT